MSNLRNLFSYAIAFSLIVVVGLAKAQTEFFEKLESKEILEVARTSTPQNLIVSFESGDIEDRIGKQRISLHMRTESARRLMNKAGISSSETNELRDDDNLLQTLHSQLESIKSSVLQSGQVGRSTMLKDFTHLSMAVVTVPDEVSLLQLLANQSVKRIYLDRKTSVSAAWPTSYSDVSIIHSDIRSGVNGYKGKGTRVIVLDTGAYLGAVPGWDDTKDGCLAYTGPNFVETNLANGQTSVSANCRIWSMFGIAGTQFLCAYPLIVDHSVYVCKTSLWQHATAVDDVIARVAPATYITNIQVVGADGTGTTQYALDGFQWVIDHATETPRIVAVNYSSAVVGPEYASACTTSRFVGPITSLLNTYGILTVVPTGNNADKFGVSEPACVPGVIAVGTTTDSTVAAASYPQYGCSDPQLAADQVPCFSNTNSTLTSMLAPGVDIGYPNELIAGDPTSVAAGSGTSLSAPHVAAAIAILRGDDAYGTTRTAAQIATMLTNAGPQVADRNSIGNVKHRLDIAAAMGTPGQSPPYPASVAASPTAVTVAVGATTTVSLTATSQFGAPMTASTPGWSFTWDTPGIASNPGGVVSGTAYQMTITGVSVGSAVVTVAAYTSDGHTARVAVPVTVSTKSGTGPPNCKTNPRACAVVIRPVN